MSFQNKIALQWCFDWKGDLPAATTNYQTIISISESPLHSWIKGRILEQSAPDYKNSFCFFFSREYSADLNLDEMITGQEGLKKIRAALWETLNGQ